MMVGRRGRGSGQHRSERRRTYFRYPRRNRLRRPERIETARGVTNRLRSIRGRGPHVRVIVRLHDARRGTTAHRWIVGSSMIPSCPHGSSTDTVTRRSLVSSTNVTHDLVNHLVNHLVVHPRMHSHLLRRRRQRGRTTWGRGSRRIWGRKMPPMYIVVNATTTRHATRCRGEKTYRAFRRWFADPDLFSFSLHLQPAMCVTPAYPIFLALEQKKIIFSFTAIVQEQN